MDNGAVGHDRLGNWIAGALVLASAAWVWFHQVGRPAWTDEAWVISFARESGWLDVLQAYLAQRQPAAPGYLLLLHFLYRSGLDWLWCYRIPSMTFGVLLLILAVGLMRRCGSGLIFAWLASLFLLICPLLQRYMTEIKQYIAEAAFSVALIFLASTWLSSSDRRVPWLGFLITLLALLMGFATWFAVLGVVLAMAMVLLWRRDYEKLATLGWMALPVFLTTVVIYHFFLRYLLVNEALYTYWWPGRTGGNQDGEWLVWTTAVQYADASWYLYLFPRWLLVALAGIGWLIWLRVQPVAAWMAGMIVLTTAGAMAMGIWPRGARVNLPIIVIGHLAICCGAAGLWGMVRPRLFARLGETSLAGVPLRRGMGLLLLMVSATAVVVESLRWDFTVAQIDRLLDEVALRSTIGQLVILDDACHVNQQFRPSLNAKVVHLSWPKLQDITSFTDEKNTIDQPRVALLAFGHHNTYAAEALSRPDRTDRLTCQLEPIWTGHLVALYQVQWLPPDTATSGPLERHAP